MVCSASVCEQYLAGFVNIFFVEEVEDYSMKGHKSFSMEYHRRIPEILLRQG
jgi:hypothetical protein